MQLYEKLLYCYCEKICVVFISGSATYLASSPNDVELLQYLIIMLVVRIGYGYMKHCKLQ